MIISGDLLLVVLSCLIISAQAGPFGRRARPSTAPVSEDNDEDHPIAMPNEITSMDENKSSNVNDREDDVILASDIVNANGNLTESENRVNVSEETSNTTSDTKDTNKEDFASKEK